MDNQFYEKVNGIKWFSNCGNVFTIEGFPIKIQFVTSIDEMMKNLSSQNWENVTLEAQNRLTAFLHENENNNYSGVWNRVTEEHKSNLIAVTKIAKKYADEMKLDKIFVDYINWNVLGAAMESHYININEGIPIFFKYLLDIYVQGNVPCGWKGKVKEILDGTPIDLSVGTLLVY